jgi:3',5'-nucleoside bisphosphate phosphatase
MKLLRADLHIHTVLSPCGDLDMSPVNIASEAAKKGLDIIGITDHNTTRHCQLIRKLAEEKGIFVMQGVEITTKEEVHCLAFFENTDELIKCQEFLDKNLPMVKNNPAKFGYQVQVDENDIVIYEEEKLLINAISKTFEETEAFVHSLNGLFIPAHVNKLKNSIYSQLGFLPTDMKADALEIAAVPSPSAFIEVHPELKAFQLISNSDAHFINDIGSVTTMFYLEETSFSEIRMALKNVNGRKIQHK